MNDYSSQKLMTNKLIAILAYIFITYIGSSLVIILIANLYSTFNSAIDFYVLMETFTSSNFDKIEEGYLNAYAIVSSLGNMVGYLILAIILGFCLRFYLKEDFLKCKKRPLYLLIYTVIAFGVFFGITYLVDFLVSQNAGSSDNQLSIEIMIKNGGAVYMFIAVVLLAPMVEELIYRKTIFSMLEKRHIAISYAVSTVCFTLPHMFTTSFADPGRWFLIMMTYAVSAVLLAVIYHKSNKNVYVSWFVHMLNNLIAFILVVV